MKKESQPKRDAPGYERQPLQLSENGKYFSIDGAQVVDLMTDYKRWGLLDKDGNFK